MERYIEQLISDIRRATWKIRPPHDLWLESEADPDNELELEDMSNVEKSIYGEKEPVSIITGIESSLLPPAEKLTEKQKELLSRELENLLEFFHFHLGFPENYPAHLRYPFIKNFWEETHVVLSFGMNHIEFCNYERKNCPFPGYCKTCDEVEAQMKHDEETEGKSAFDIDVNDLILTPEEIEKWWKQQKNFNPEMDFPPSTPLDEEDNENDYHEDMNGFFNDDGSKIDPETVPLPSLCVICKKYLSDDWEENMLCLLNRNDQKNANRFKCGAFEKID